MCVCVCVCARARKLHIFQNAQCGGGRTEMGYCMFSKTFTHPRIFWDQLNSSKSIYLYVFNCTMKFIIQAMKIFTEHYNIVCTMLISSSRHCCHIDGKNVYNQRDYKWHSSARISKCRNEGRVKYQHRQQMVAKCVPQF